MFLSLSLSLLVNCWPSENAGTCDVNVEYELKQTYLELNNVVITIPVPWVKLTQYAHTHVLYMYYSIQAKVHILSFQCTVLAVCSFVCVFTMISWLGCHEFLVVFSFVGYISHASLSTQHYFNLAYVSYVCGGGPPTRITSLFHSPFLCVWSIVSSYTMILLS